MTGAATPWSTVIDAESLGVSRFMLEALLAAEPCADRRRVQLCCSRPPAQGEVLVDSPTMLEIFAFLVIRAVERTPPDGVVSIGAVALGDEVCFSISDAGDARRVVDDRSWKAASVAIEAHGGRLWMDCAPSEGSTCRFTLLSRPHVHA